MPQIKVFTLGQIFKVVDSNVQIPDADKAGDRNKHSFRSVIVVSNNLTNTDAHTPTILICPLTHRTDLQRRFDVPLFKSEDSVMQDCLARLQLIQPICKTDLVDYYGSISEDKQAEVIDALSELLGIE